MREIKFRGKDEFGDWQYGSLIINVDTFKIFNSMNDYEEVDEDTVGQYTGLKDKNGKEIYEGDILKTDLERDYLIAVFRNGAFMFDCFDKKHYYDIMLPVDSESTCVCEEIIGNIYDNSELLKESEETK